MNFGEMQTKVRRRLNESTSAFFSDSDIQTAINEGYAELADATDFYEREATVPCLKKRTYYDLSLIVPDTFLSPRRIFNPTTNEWLTPTVPSELDGEFRQWELVNGEPQRYFLRGNWWLGVFPRPSQDSLGLRFYYSAIPPAMSDDTEEPEFPREFHEGLIDFALSDLMAQQRETKKAVAYWTSYKSHEDGLRLYVDGRVKLAQRTVL